MCRYLSVLQVVSGSDVVVLAVKPDVIPAVLMEIAPHLTEASLVVSIAAGVPLAVLEEVRGSFPRTRLYPGPNDTPGQNRSFM